MDDKRALRIKRGADTGADAGVAPRRPRAERVVGDGVGRGVGAPAGGGEGDDAVANDVVEHQRGLAGFVKDVRRKCRRN